MFDFIFGRPKPAPVRQDVMQLNQLAVEIGSSVRLDGSTQGLATFIHELARLNYDHMRWLEQNGGRLTALDPAPKGPER